MIKFSKIGALYNVAKYVTYVNSADDIPDKYKVRSPVEYLGTVKLHGTNAGVLCREDGTFVPQSRNRVLSVDDDHAGFAKFVAEHQDEISDYVDRIKERLGVTGDVVVYGEWVGPGIQSKVAVCHLPAKQWVIFAARVAEEGAPYLELHKAFREDDLPEGPIQNVFQGPTWRVTIDFSDKQSREDAVAYVTESTLEVGQRCPWAARFGCEGVGEGIVWMPQGNLFGNSDLMFKSKSKDHKVKSKNPQKVSMDPEVLQSIGDFVEYAVTENRLAQGIEAIREMGHPVDMKSTKHYLGWVGNDVRTECQDELEASNLEWKQVAKFVNDRALAFWKDQVQAL